MCIGAQFHPLFVQSAQLSENARISIYRMCQQTVLAAQKVSAFCTLRLITSPEKV